MNLKRFSLLLALSFSLSSCTGMWSNHSTEESWRSERDAGLESLRVKDYVSAEKLLRSALTSATKLKKESPTQYAQSLQEMGDLFIEVHKLGEAKGMYARAAKAYEVVEGSPNISELTQRSVKLGRARSLHGIAKTDLELGNYGEAEKRLKAAYELTKYGFGGHPIMPEIKKDLGLALTKQSKTAEAKAFLDDTTDDPLHGL